MQSQARGEYNSIAFINIFHFLFIAPHVFQIQISLTFCWIWSYSGSGSRPSLAKNYSKKNVKKPKYDMFFLGLLKKDFQLSGSMKVLIFSFLGGSFWPGWIRILSRIFNPESRIHWSKSNLDPIRIWNTDKHYLELRMSCFQVEWLSLDSALFYNLEVIIIIIFIFPSMLESIGYGIILSTINMVRTEKRTSFIPWQLQERWNSCVIFHTITFCFNDAFQSFF